jgi:transposase InsO family protein
MPWKSGTVMDSRQEFVRLVEQGGVSMTELCRRFGISRETGYVYLRRHRADAADVLDDRSSRPRSSPKRCPPEIEAHIIALRERHPQWGGRKLARRLCDLGIEGVPAVSTVTEVLRRHGKLDPTEMAKRQTFKRFERSTPNDLWQMDFKGHFPMESGRCHALTVLDDHSRYSLGVIACADETEATVKTHLCGLFRHYGLPAHMLADNGSPWGNSGGDGYTALEVWLLQLGVRLHHGRAYHPQTQGKDERFHRTLDVEVLQANRFADLAACQRAFDRFRLIYNGERPHEALGLAVPQSRYQASGIAFPEQLATPDYYTTDTVRRVHADGAASLHGRRVKLSQAFRGLDVAFRPSATDGLWQVYFMRFPIAEVDLRDPKAHSATVRKVSERV